MPAQWSLWSCVKRTPSTASGESPHAAMRFVSSRQESPQSTSSSFPPPRTARQFPFDPLPKTRSFMNGPNANAYAWIRALAASTFSASFALWARNFPRRTGSAVPRIWTARSAAFTGPALPQATVATGTPEGICTVA